MFCPQCRLEYRDELTRCSDCDVPLVETLPPDPEEGDPAPLDLVTVFEAGDPVLLAMAHSLLDEEKIPYLTTGEGLQDLFGFGRIGTGYSTLVGPAQIQVEAERAEEIRALLAKLEEGAPLAEGEAPPDEGEAPPV